MILDDSHLPLAILTCPSEFSARTVSELEEGYERIFARKTRFLVIADLSPITKVPDAILRKQLAALLNRPDFQQRQARYQVGSANLVHSAPIRAALTALLWLWKPSSPMSAPKDRAEAVEWAFARLRAEGVAIPPEVVAFGRAYATPPSARSAR